MTDVQLCDSACLQHVASANAKLHLGDNLAASSPTTMPGTLNLLLIS